MKEIIELLEDIKKGINLKFRLLDEKNNVVLDNLPYSEANISKWINIGGDTFKIVLDRENNNLFPLIEFTIGKLSSKDNLVEDLLEGRKNIDSLRSHSIYKGNKILLLEVRDKKTVLDIVKSTYSDTDFYVSEVYDRISIIGNLEDEIEHALSLKHFIEEDLGDQAKIAISEIKDNSIEGFRNSYEEAVIALEIGSYFKIKPEIYIIKNMFLEKTIFNISKEYLNELKVIYKDIFINFNYELFQTLEEVLACNLSLSKASKNLYIHRNTLMYRIDKIKKETGFDIRNFKEATFLYILYMNSKV